MKKILSILALLMLLAASGSAQSLWPALTVRDMGGRPRSLSSYAADSGTTLFVFWKTCCPNNIEMLEELHRIWTAHNHSCCPIRIVLVSLDDQRTASRVRPLVGANGWNWEVIMDRNGDVARACNVIMPPQWGRFRSERTGGFPQQGCQWMARCSHLFDALIDTLQTQKIP